MEMMSVMGVWIIMDETMSAYPPRTTKTVGLSNISFIKRRPKPLGTEAKTTCDCATDVMVHFKVHKGKDAMRVKEHAPEPGVPQPHDVLCTWPNALLMYAQ